jgi:hypothetical protein
MALSVVKFDLVHDAAGALEQHRDSRRQPAIRRDIFVAILRQRAAFPALNSLM